MNETLITLIQPGDELTVNGLALTAAGSPEKVHDKQLLRFYEAHGGIVNGYIVAARDQAGFQSGIYLYAIECVRRGDVLLWDAEQGLLNPEPVQMSLF
jgi:hypothetical protein